jgi:uncharacterized protein (TIGR00645 family)
MPDSTTFRPPYQNALGGLIFFSRWLQAPLYIGLIVVQAIYVYQFFHELVILVQNVFFPGGDLVKTGAEAVKAVGEAAGKFDEKDLMVAVLKLVDVVMVANLLVMVIVGGYETFVSRLNLKNHPDQPEWLSHVNAGVLKVKLATALIGISSIQLLTTFVELGGAKDLVEISPAKASGAAPLHWDVFWQVVVHLTFVLSALLLAITDRITVKTAAEARHS